MFLYLVNLDFIVIGVSLARYFLCSAVSDDFIFQLLREQIARQRVGTSDEGLSLPRHFPAYEREELVKKLEISREEVRKCVIKESMSGEHYCMGEMYEDMW